ncbi:MAG: DUF4230 domain-containing protein [Candidatus Amulumruptor caecigallinarius]|nr:DUF4230 domain-containing protein [Candidatus Amulumruptor caecigallinarius]
MFVLKAAAAMIAIFAMTACSTSPESDKSELPVNLYEEIRSTNKMVFASMSVSKTISSDREAWYKIGKRIAVYSYNAYLDAYIDLSQLRESDLVFDDEIKSVTISLPPVEVEIAGRDMELKKEYENIGFFRSNLDSKERAEMKELANSSFLKEVNENPVFKRNLVGRAENAATGYFKALFEKNGYSAVVKFKQESVL